MNLEKLDVTVLEMISDYIKDFMVTEIEKFNEKGAIAIKNIYFDIEGIIDNKKKGGIEE